jgi:cyclohexanone monooxygenase
VSAYRQFDALVVGAGFAGLYMLHRLREAGFSAHVIEAGSGVGGTWYWNRYPGARCDVPSIEYSYSFSPELEREWRWSERYAAQPEILKYLEHVAERFDLNKDITFGDRVTAASWNELDKVWIVETDAGETWRAAHFILASGALSAPKTPDLPGIERFEGTVVHTATWDDAVSIEGQDVALFGTGSSGIQVLPRLADKARHVTVFQRTPNFAVPASNRPLSDEEWEASRATVADQRDVARQGFLGFFDMPRPGSAKADDPAARDKRFAEQWNAGTAGLLLSYEDLLVDEESNAHAAEFARGKIAELVRDPAKVRKLTPQDYPLGARRMCSEIGFYEAMNRDNVDLVDVREEPVVDMSGTTIITSNGRYPADVVVLATGFDACVGAIKAIDIRGRGGKSIRQEWVDGPHAYLGLAVPGFPNMFTVTGPGSPSILSNVVVSIEQHVEWIAQCLADMRARGAATIEATHEAEAEWMQHVHDVAQQTLFPRANSWYHGRTRDGRKAFMPYVGGCGPYRAKCDDVRAAGYEGFRFGGSK